MISSFPITNVQSPQVDSKLVFGHIRQFGYAHLRSLLPRGLVQIAHSQVIEILRRLAICNVDDDRFLSPKARSISDLQQLILEARKHAEAIQSLHQLTHTAALHGLIKDLLNDDIYLHPRKFLRIGLPHSRYPQATTAHHQDYRYVQGALDTLTVWIPLADYEIVNGILSVVPQSHQNGLAPIARQPGGAFEYVVEGVEANDRISSVRAGDCIIFHSLTIHGAHRNISSRIRLSIDCRFQRAHDQLARPAMLAPFTCDAGVDQNDPRSWSKDPWYNQPLTLQLCEACDFRSVSLSGSSSFVTDEEKHAL